MVFPPPLRLSDSFVLQTVNKAEFDSSAWVCDEYIFSFNRQKCVCCKAIHEAHMTVFKHFNILQMIYHW